MSLPTSLVESLDPPICPYCHQTMEPHHGATWVHRAWVYTHIEFRCIVTGPDLPHKMYLTAATLEQWYAHQRNLSRLRAGIAAASSAKT